MNLNQTPKQIPNFWDLFIEQRRPKECLEDVQRIGMKQWEIHKYNHKIWKKLDKRSSYYEHKILIKESLDMVNAIIPKIESCIYDLVALRQKASKYMLGIESNEKISIEDEMKINEFYFRLQEQVKYMMSMKLHLEKCLPAWDGEYEEKTNDPT